MFNLYSHNTQRFLCFNRAKSNFSYSILIFSLLCDGFLVTQEVSGGNRDVILLHTNDQHFNSHKHFDAVQSKVARFRDQYTDVFLLDAGDFTIRQSRWAQRGIVNNASEYEQQIKSMISSMNALGYDAAVLGNHELGYYETVTRDVLRTADFPILGANVIVSTEQFIEPKSYVIFETGDGIRLAILGICGGKFDDAEGIHLSSATETVLKYKDLRNKSQAFILLTHIGVRSDRRLADKYGDMIDIIVGGHSHTLLDPLEIRNGVLIAQAGHSYGAHRYLGVIRMTFNSDGEMTNKEGEVLKFTDETFTQSQFLNQSQLNGESNKTGSDGALQNN